MFRAFVPIVCAPKTRLRIQKEGVARACLTPMLTSVGSWVLLAGRGSPSEASVARLRLGLRLVAVWEVAVVLGPASEHRCEGYVDDPHRENPAR